MTAQAESYRSLLRALVRDLKQRWSVGAPKDDAYKYGFNSGLFSALYAIEELAHNLGITREEIALDELPDPTKGTAD